MKIKSKNNHYFNKNEIGLVIIKSKGEYTFDVDYFKYNCEELPSLAFEYLDTDFIVIDELDEYLESLKKEWDVIYLNDIKVKTCDMFEKANKE